MFAGGPGVASVTSQRPPKPSCHHAVQLVGTLVHPVDALQKHKHTHWSTRQSREPDYEWLYFGSGVQRVTFCALVCCRAWALSCGTRHTCVYTTAQTHTKINNTKITLIYVTLSLALVWHVLCIFFFGNASVRICGRFICMCVGCSCYSIQ